MIDPVNKMEIKDKTLTKSLSLLSSPLSLAAILILAANSFALRVYWPSWFTGKLSDFAWLYFTPFALAAFLSLVIPSDVKAKSRLIEILAFSTIFGIFIIANSFQPWNEWLVNALSQVLGSPIMITRDPSDLIALVSTLLAWHHWKNWVLPQTIRDKRALLLLPLCSLLVIADAGYPNYGIDCLISDEDQIIAFAGYYDEIFRSTDSGLSWSQIVEYPDRDELGCQYYGEWGERSISSPDRELLFQLSKNGVFEQSLDGGKTWEPVTDYIYPSEAETIFYQKTHRNRLAYYSPGPLDAFFDLNSGFFIFAMGVDGVLIRTSEGEWITVPVGEYKIESLSISKIPEIIYLEIILGVILIILLLLTTWHFSSYNLLRKIILLLVWLVWLANVFLFQPAISIDYTWPLIVISIAFGGLFSIMMLIENSLNDQVVTSTNRIRRTIFAIAGGILFVFPYILWTVNIIPSYKTSMIIAASVSILILVIMLIIFRKKKTPVESALTELLDQKIDPSSGEE